MSSLSMLLLYTVNLAFAVLCCIIGGYLLFDDMTVLRHWSSALPVSFTMPLLSPMTSGIKHLDPDAGHDAVADVDHLTSSNALSILTLLCHANLIFREYLFPRAKLSRVTRPQTTPARDVEQVGAIDMDGKGDLG
jgi:hypothetical protein